MVINRPDDLGDIADLGLTLAQGKQLTALVQQAIVTAQSRDHATRRPDCRTCTIPCQVKDYRPHQIATVFGQVVLRLPHFRCAGCGGTEAGVDWPSHCRSTPELDQLRAHLSSPMPYRIAAGPLEHLLPVDAGIHRETVRRRTLRVGGQLRDVAPAEPAAPAVAITLTLDSTFIRSCEDGERHLEFRLGNVETSHGVRQVFAAVAKTDTSVEALIQRGLKEVGQTTDTEPTAFTDGCSGLRSILVNAGVTEPPGLDWFHIAMRLQHAGKTAGNLPIDTSERENARVAIVAEVDRLRWRIWNGKAKDAKVTLERIRQVMPVFQGNGDRKCHPSSRQLWTALREIDRYLSSQSAWLVNYAERHRAGLPVGTSVTEGTANFLVNHRMNKSQQMRWSHHGADLLLQVRCAVLNGKFGPGVRQLLDANSGPETAMAA
ncbi:hypothetical protein N825_29960 [Skermanella stibiiresistens SB22]|uniref:Transposase n=2 Tax=Skermanella TaxID=204447 RepID=W9GQ99_9PROT|nr:hypothetical protein N825_29960 [Skermanella stibiiresistens SB22]